MCSHACRLNDSESLNDSQPFNTGPETFLSTKKVGSKVPKRSQAEEVKSRLFGDIPAKDVQHIISINQGWHDFQSTTLYDLSFPGSVQENHLHSMLSTLSGGGIC